jgi:WD40 repeat protein
VKATPAIGKNVHRCIFWKLSSTRSTFDNRIGNFIGHKGAVWGATITGNAELAATAGSDFTAKLWDANTGVELRTFDHKHIVRSVEFSSINTEWLLTGSNEKVIKIYDVTASTGRSVPTIG